MDNDSNPQAKTVIVYDTFCGWCHGAAPVLDAIVNTGENVEVLHRHLFQGANAPKMSEGKGDHIMRTTPQIEALTGQKFSEDFKEKIARSSSEYLESGLSAQAAALVHDEGPAREFAIRQRLQTLHFIEGMSTNNRDAIVDALIAEGVDPEQANRIGTPELETKAKALSERAQSMMDSVHSMGVPTVLKIDEKGVRPLDHQAFYGRAEVITEIEDLQPRA